MRTRSAAFAAPPVKLSDVAAGTGGFVTIGIDAQDFSGVTVSSTVDVYGDSLAGRRGLPLNDPAVWLSNSVE